MKSNDNIFKFYFSKYLYLLISLYLFVWIAIRSYNLDFTNDEAYSFYNVYLKHYKMMLGTANTHWINSLFLFIENMLLGNKEWMLRIHSVLSFAGVSYFFYKIFEDKIKIQQLLFGIAFFLLNVYIFDFYSLARGYGLSIFFEIVFIYLLLKKEDNGKNKFIAYALLSLSIFSNYMMLFLGLSYIILDFIYLLSKNKNLGKSIKTWLLHVSPFIFCSLITIPNLIFIKRSGDLNEGQANGFLEDSIGVFISRSFETFFTTQTTAIIASLLFFLIILFFYFFKKEIDSKYRLLFYVFFINVLLIEFFYIFLNVPFCFGRTSLYLNVLLIILLIYTFSFLIEKSKFHFEIGFFVFFMSFIYFLFYKNMNTTVEWWKSQGIKESMNYLLNESKEDIGNKKLGMHLAQYGTYVNYYNLLNHYPFNDTVYSFSESANDQYDSTTIQKIYTLDYLILLKPYATQFDTSRFQILKYYQDMNSDLIKLKK